MITTPRVLLSAELEIVDLGAGNGFGIFRGAITDGDEQRFAKAVSDYKTLIVVFDSLGGDLRAALEIGRLINSRGDVTGVGPGMVCASACALVWAAGRSKAMAPDALVGFHAAYTLSEGGPSISAVGNALIGAYLNEIGFTEYGVAFATTAGPDSIQWLTLAHAREAGLNVAVLDFSGQIVEESNGSPSTITLRLPSEFRWVVLASSLSIEALRARAAAVQDDQLRIVLTKSGYHALVAGPFRTSDAEAILTDMVNLAPDAYLSSGNGFTALVD